MRKLLLLSLLGLTACAQAQVHSNLKQGFDRELYAWQRAQEQYDAQCPHGTPDKPLPSSQALVMTECYEKIARRAVEPVVVDHLAFNDLMLTYKKIGLERKKNHIDADEAKIATLEAWNSYTKTVNSKANAVLQQAYQQDQQTLQQMRGLSQQQAVQAQQCDSISIAPLASLGCKNVCINGRWAEVC